MAEVNHEALLPTNTKISVEEPRTEKTARGAEVDPSLDTGWAWIIVLASFFSLTINCGLLYGTGILQIALLETYHKNVTKTAWVGAIFSSMVSMTAPLAALIINYTSCRTAMICGSILTMIGFAASSVVREFDLLIFTCGIMAGSGLGITYTTGMVVIGYNFNHKRNLASGIVASGAGMGTFLMPMAWKILLDNYSLSGTFLLIGGITFNLCIAGALYRPSRLELKLQVSSPCHCGVIRPSSTSCKSLSLLSNCSFVLFCVSILLWSTGIAGVYLHLPSYAIANGFSDSSALFLISVMGLATIPGRILTGIAATSNDVDELVLYGGTFGLTGIATLMLPLVAKHYAGYLIYALVCGFYSGGVYAILLTITTFLVGIDNLSVAFAAEMVFCGIGYLIGPLLAGIVYEVSGSFEYSFFLVGICILLGGLLGWFTKLGSNHVFNVNVDMKADTDSHAPERQRLTADVDKSS